MYDAYYSALPIKIYDTDYMYYKNITYVVYYIQS